LIRRNLKQRKKTRKAQNDLYDFEMKEPEQHLRLLKLAKQLPCQVLITHYPAPLYFENLDGWQYQKFYSNDRSGARNEEIAFFNYPLPLMLHDFRFLGNNFRERANITRQQKRWKQKLDKMSVLQRQAMLSVILENYAMDPIANSGAAGVSETKTLSDLAAPKMAIAAGTFHNGS